MEDSVFTKIIKRELSAEIVYEDERVIAILNLFPNIEGETLVIPKEQISYFADLSDDSYLYVMRVVKKISKALDVAFSTERTCVVIEGFDVPHVHVRLYPVREGRLNLSHGPQATPEALAAAGEKIRANL